MKKRLSAAIFSMFLGIALLVGCTAQEQPEQPQEEVQDEGQKQADEDLEESMEVTLQELSQYNGKEGNPAYIAVDGVVYDVTDHPGWKDGMHSGVSAGQDITQQLKEAPHGDSKLEGLKVVGRIAE
ncbi:Predicted heme/steroid binding protein [Peptoclostridium litorale DSM 5388]|uniref:Cytochrome b5 heme-binding domain-containing protein n=1 Tax=Peptoclostridium litorale DSM 5388 TaxID=1121324 RepID=A0A069RIH0_PEPLI|nr:cytochrome b5 domain-containing protein [Peptoclostridium litorale]KDR96578.1 hypothetical protein CLIT_2c01840 [Peptoclostridium litorale DSM 5388]SIN68898.1 Predicted heme/steroid binding protein [Peptoclostridium litorale DSM 5388]